MGEYGMRVVSVGEPWAEDVTLPLPEGPQLILHQVVELGIVVKKPTVAEIQAVEEGTFEFAVTVVEPVVFLLYRCDPVFGWSDAPYNIQRSDEETKKYWLGRNYKPTDHPFCNIMLVDADTNRIAAMRAFTLPPSVAFPLFEAVHKQAKGAYSNQVYDAILNGIYARTTSADLAAQAIGKGVGGT